MLLVFDKQSIQTSKQASKQAANLNKIIHIITLVVPQLATLLLQHSSKHAKVMIQGLLIMQVNVRIEATIPIIAPIDHSTDTAMKQAHSAHNAGLARNHHIAVSAEIRIFLRSSLPSKLYVHSLALISDASKAAVVQKHGLSVVAALAHHVPVLVQNNHSDWQIAVQKRQMAEFDRQPHSRDISLLFLRG